MIISQVSYRTNGPLVKCASVITVSPQVCYLCPGLHDFSLKNNEINESYKLCQVRGKHTVGGIVFYKHLFLVNH